MFDEQHNDDLDGMGDQFPPDNGFYLDHFSWLTLFDEEVAQIEPSAVDPGHVNYNQQPDEYNFLGNGLPDLTTNLEGPFDHTQVVQYPNLPVSADETSQWNGFDGNADFDRCDDAGIDLAHLTLDDKSYDVHTHGYHTAQTESGAWAFMPLFPMLPASALPGEVPYDGQELPATVSRPSASSSTSSTVKKGHRSPFRRSPKVKITTVKTRKDRKPNPRFKCPCCMIISSDTRALHRHMWAEHAGYAEQNNIPSENEPCGYPECDYRGRKDNVRRHREKKHPAGGE